jgi:hypothetical protein
MDEGFRRMDDRTEKRHKEIVELLKRGFGKVMEKVK